ncbi:unnamed protein product, partial [Ectocarpus sp. 12 AP-2014]
PTHTRLFFCCFGLTIAAAYLGFGSLLKACHRWNHTRTRFFVALGGRERRCLGTVFFLTRDLSSCGVLVWWFDVAAAYQGCGSPAKACCRWRHIHTHVFFLFFTVGHSRARAIC